MIIVSDTSALGNLAIVNQLTLLQALYNTVVIPDVVAQELSNATSPKICTIISLEWIQVQSITNQAMADALQQNSNLDPGESHAIVLALEQQADELLIDERRGRQEAMKLGIPIIGILGVLLLAKQRGLVPQVQPTMDALIEQAGFRVSSQLYAQVLSQANEE
jgi:predicted nucleic acid-binding protein